MDYALNYLRRYFFVILSLRFNYLEQTDFKQLRWKKQVVGTSSFDPPYSLILVDWLFFPL